MFYGISARKKGAKKYKAYNFSTNSFYNDMFFQSLWNDQGYVKDLIKSLKKENSNFEFKIDKRLDIE